MMGILNSRNRLRRVFSEWIMFTILVSLPGIFVPNFNLRADDTIVLAKIENIEITQRDLEDRLNKLPENQKIVYETEKGKQELLQEMVRLEIFYREALEKELNQNPDYQAKIERISKGMLASIFVKQYILAADVLSADEVERYYQRHTDQYIEPEKIKVQSIFFPISEKQPIKIAQEKANKAMVRLRKGESFIQLSKQISENTTPINLDYFARGRLDPAIEKQVFSMDIGGISPILQVEDGLIVFRLEDKVPSKKLSFEEVKDRVIETLKEEKRKERFYLIERQLLNKYKVSFNGAEKTQTTMTKKRPDIQGIINRIILDEESSRMTISKLEIDNLHVLITPDTEIFEKQDNNNYMSSVGKLRVGQKVAVYSTGPVMQSFPPQARAMKIVIMDLE